jgi:hypothetical protein
VTVRGVTPYLVIQCTAAALDWCRDVLGAVEVGRMRPTSAAWTRSDSSRLPRPGPMISA